MMLLRILPLLLLLTGCTNWHPVSIPTPEERGTILLGSVQVTERNGDRHAGTRLTVGAQHLILTRIDGTLDSVLIADVRSVERGEIDDQRSFGLVALFVGISIALLAYVAAAYRGST